MSNVCIFFQFHRIHVWYIFTYTYHRNQPFMQVDIQSSPWILRECRWKFLSNLCWPLGSESAPTSATSGTKAWDQQVKESPCRCWPTWPFEEPSFECLGLFLWKNGYVFFQNPCGSKDPLLGMHLVRVQNFWGIKYQPSGGWILGSIRVESLDLWTKPW